MTTERQTAICELVNRVDRFDAIRGHRITQEGKPDRYQLWKDLPCRYVNVRRQERENERTQ